VGGVHRSPICERNALGRRRAFVKRSSCRQHRSRHARVEYDARQYRIVGSGVFTRGSLRRKEALNASWIAALVLAAHAALISSIERDVAVASTTAGALGS
jgi:hypothetical protein